MESPSADKQQKFRKRIPLGKAVVVGDPQKKGQPNPEIVHATKKGVTVTPLKGRKYPKGMKRCAFGAGPTWTGDLGAIGQEQARTLPDWKNPAMALAQRSGAAAAMATAAPKAGQLMRRRPRRAGGFDMDEDAAPVAGASMMMGAATGPPVPSPFPRRGIHLSAGY